MEARAESPHTRALADVGTDMTKSCGSIRCYYPGSCTLGGGGEYCLRNPLREICTVGSVRGETSVGHGGSSRARSRKRWIEA
jgi:hypothetical protein